MSPRIIGLVACAALAAACDGRRDPPAPDARSSGLASTASTSAAPATGSASSGSSAAPGHPMKAYAFTADERVGKLPDGVGIAVGARAPDFTIDDASGGNVRLADLIAKGHVLLSFYRGGWCPYCSFEVHDLTDAYPEFRKRGVTPVAISVDRPEESSKTAATYEIPFPVLSDPDLVAHRAFRVVHVADEAEFGKLKSFGIDLERASGRDHHSFAIPSYFLVSRDGIVRWAHADAEYKVRPSRRQLLAAVDAARLLPP
ncbi:MAG: AhpC/TSA family protein [Myxococcales bacterium]|nr:AhpC/TSA family protein [Myxococcales bacterium]